MLFGSYVAGSTPMGGGTVGFPVLVLLFDQSPLLGRDLSFAMQSIGMVSAGIFILVRRQEVAGGALMAATTGVGIEFVWTYYENLGALGLRGLALGVVALLAFQGLFHLLFVLGRKRAMAAPGLDPDTLGTGAAVARKTP